MTRNAAVVAVRVPRDLARDFAVVAEREERSVSAELRRLMRQHVSSNEATPLAGGADSQQPAGGPDYGEG